LVGGMKHLRGNAYTHGSLILGWLMSIRTEPRRGVQRGVQKAENAPLHAGQGRQVIPPPTCSDARQGQPLNTLEQALGGRAGRRPLGVPSRHPRQPRAGGGQPLADHTRQPSQHPPPARPPSAQAGSMIVPLQRHRGHGQGRPIQPAHVTLDQVWAVVGQHCRRQRERLGRGVGGLDPPAAPADGRYRGSSARCPGTTSVATGHPRGSSPDSSTVTCGRSGR
jgi:hypothetical protein